jgi:hypothetical protein
MRELATTLPFFELGSRGLPTTIEVFLRHGATGKGGEHVDLSETSPRTFADRLQLVVNSWYQLFLSGSSSIFFGDNPDPTAHPAAYGYDFAQLPADGNVSQAVVDASCKLFCSRSTRATLTRTVEVYTYNKLWLALLFASSAVLLATGLVGKVLERRTLAPDMLGYVASMTYNNPYLALPDHDGGGGAALDAMQRVRLLGNMRVKFGDVRGDEEVGRLAFTLDSDTRALEKGRKYV